MLNKEGRFLMIVTNREKFNLNTKSFLRSQTFNRAITSFCTKFYFLYL